MLDNIQQYFELAEPERERGREKHTVYVKSLDNNLQLHLIGHVAQWAHGHPQLLLWDEAIPIPVKYLESLTNLCWEKEDSNYIKSGEEGGKACL